MQIPKEIASITISEYDYPLPDERIARYPLEDRASCKLMYYDRGFINTHFFRDIPSLLPSNALLIRNNTRVIKARIHMQKATGANIEILCLEPKVPQQYELSLASTQSCVWHCMIGNARRWKEDKLERVIHSKKGEEIKFYAEKIEGEGFIRFSWDNTNYTFAELLEYVGILPIPPYLHRETEERDNQDYQTVYAQHKGSVAAPTAGLHFTEKEFSAIVKRGIPISELTLHVGAGTFLPVKTEEIGGHTMHKELCVVEKQTIELLLQDYSPIIAVGTTSVRTLESLFYLAKNHLDELQKELSVSKIPLVQQWEPYQEREEKGAEAKELLQKLLQKMEELEFERVIFATTLLIVPSYKFQIVSGLITNFHQPKSTLLLMIAAFIGEDWKKVYDYALDNKYRFLSYGDGSLILP